MSDIYKYSEFILEYSKKIDTRSQVINIPKGKTVIDIIRERAPWYLENIDKMQPIYRGLRSDRNKKGGRYTKDKYQDTYEECLYINPSIHERKASNIPNHYLIIIDGSKYWKGFPKRSQSIICSTGFDYAQIYSEVYRVIPLENNTNFVVNPTGDVFTSFGYLFEQLIKYKLCNYVIRSLREFSELLTNEFGLNYTHKTVSEIEIGMAKFMSNIQDEKFTENRYKVRWFIEKYLDGDIPWDNLYDEIDRWMSPRLNGFEKIKYNSEFKINNEREVYTDAEYILVLESKLQEYLK